MEYLLEVFTMVIYYGVFTRGINLGYLPGVFAMEYLLGVFTRGICYGVFTRGIY